jgi:hypothetical protein
LIILGITWVSISAIAATTLTWYLNREEMAPRWLILSGSTTIYVLFSTFGFYLMQDNWTAAALSAVLSLAVMIPAGIGIALSGES